MKEHQTAERRPTAGLRGASWNPSKVPQAMKTLTVPLATSDGAQIIGYLHACGGERNVVMIMHPRELLASHYIVPYLVATGYACWVQGPRTVGNDLRLEHEVAILDAAAGVTHLRDTGFRKIILLGNSGGAGLFAFYNQQALLDGANRITKTPGGRPVKLSEASMPAVDGFIFIAPHPGQGHLLLNCIDPSVVDEADPLSVAPALYPFSEMNGFQAFPQVTRYAPEFLLAYRTAQRERVERIDHAAQAMIALRMASRRRAKNEASVDDLSIDPSDRRWGTVWGADPLASNLGGVGFARVCTPESWLSTWSAVSSNASFERCGTFIEQPTLMIYYTGDNTVFPGDARSIFESIGTNDKIRHDVQGNHHGQALQAGGPLGQDGAGAIVVEWLNSHFG